MIPELFLIAAVGGALSALLADIRAKHPAVLGLPFSIIGFATAELAGFLIAAQIVITPVWIVFGALDEPEGWYGLGLTAASLAGLAVADRRSHRAGEVVVSAFAEAGLDLEAHQPARARLLRPFSHRRPGVTVERNLPYGEHRRHRFDLHRPAEADGAPVLLQIHGGGWVSGNKRQQGQALLAHAADQGWIGVAINYRLGPRTRFPDILVDVKKAIAHVKAHAPGWGGDPGRVVVTGGSAGGHLTALAALTGDDSRWQPGFETTDCSVAAAIPFYGVYDLTDRAGHRGRAAMTPFLNRMVMSTKLAADPDGWAALSPISLVRPDAPPMLIIGCGLDLLVPIEETRDFAMALGETSTVPPVYVELPYAQHAFDLIASPRTLHVVNAVTAWATQTVRGVSPSRH